MLDKIKELLGEELSNQVTQKLGEIELSVMNDGTVVYAAKHDSLKTEMKTLQDKYDSDLLSINTKLEAATTNAADYDSLKGTLETLRADNIKAAEDHKLETARIRKNNAINVELLKNNVDEQYLDIVKSQINTDNLIYDGDNLIGLSDSINLVREKFPKLFGQMKKTGASPTGNDINPPVGQKQQLIEQYNQAQVSKNVKLMMSLSNKIKQLE